MSNCNDSLKFVYEHIPVKDQLYNSYQEFMKDFHQKEEKSLKQLFIIKERIKERHQCAETIIQEFREKVEKEIEDNPKRRKIDA